MSAAAPLRALPLPPRSAARPGTRSNARPATSPAAAERPKLVVVPAPTAGRVPFVLAVAGVLAAGLVTLLMLHTLAAQDAFTVHKLARQSAALADQEQALAVANEQAQAPSDLALRAAALGMVPASSLTVTRLHGRPVAVLTAPKLPPPAPATTPTPKSTPTPTATKKPAAKPATTTAATTKPAAKPAAKPTHH